MIPNKGGRPPKRPEDSRPKSLPLYLTPQERTQLDALVDLLQEESAGAVLSKSSVIRRLIWEEYSLHEEQIRYRQRLKETES